MMTKPASSVVRNQFDRSKVSGGKSALVLSLVLLVFSLFVFLHGMRTWNVAVTSPWSAMNSDQMLIGTMYYKHADHTLFSRDYVFQDERYTSYYTPSFFYVITPFIYLTGDFIRGLGALQAPLLLVYLAAAYALFSQVSGSHGVALACALLSTLPVRAGEVWGAVGLELMYPRTVALPIMLLTVYVLLKLLNPEDRLQRKSWAWPLLGLLLGLVANLHPPTGVGFAVIIGIASCASWYRGGLPAFRKIGILVVCTLICSSPILWNMITKTGVPPGSTSTEFQGYVLAFIERVRMLPYSGAGSRLSLLSGEWQLALGFLWFPLTLIAWLAIKGNSRAWSALSFAYLQLFYAWLWANGIDSIWFLIPGLLFLWRWWLKDDGREMVFFELMAGVIAACFFIPVVLYAIWLELEVWALTLVVAELPRGSRVLILVFYLTVARFGMHSLDLIARWSQASPQLRAIWVGVGTALGLEAVFRVTVPIAQSSTVHWIPSAIALGMGAIVVAGTWFLLQQNLSCWGSRRGLLAALALGSTAIVVGAALVLPGEFGRKIIDRMQLRAMAAIALVVPSAKKHESMPALIETAQWASLNTSKDALFLYAPADVGWTFRGSEFRYWSKRSILYDWKSLNQIAYSRPAELVSVRRQLQRIVDATRVPERLIQIARDLHADYIVRDAEMPLDLPIAYRNESVIVHALS